MVAAAAWEFSSFAGGEQEEECIQHIHTSRPVFHSRPSVCLFIWKEQNSSAYLETSGGLPTTACCTNTSDYEVPCSKMTSFSKCSLYLASHSSKVHLYPNSSFSVSQAATSAAIVRSVSPVLLAWKLEILQIYNNLSKVFMINGGNHNWTEQFIPALTPLNYTWDKFELLFIVQVLTTQHSSWDCVWGSRWKRSMSSFCPLTVSYIVHRWMSLLEISSEADDFVSIELNKSNNLFSLLRRFILAYLETENETLQLFLVLIIKIMKETVS